MAISASGSVRQGGSSGSSAAIRQASRPSGSSSWSTETQATQALSRSFSIRRVRAAVLPKPAGAATSTRRRLSAAAAMASSSRRRATRLARTRGGWIFVSAKDGAAMGSQSLLCVSRRPLRLRPLTSPTRMVVHEVSPRRPRRRTPVLSAAGHPAHRPSRHPRLAAALRRERASSPTAPRTEAGRAISLARAVRELQARIATLPTPSSLQREPNGNKSSDLPVGISGPLVRLRPGATEGE